MRQGDRVWWQSRRVTKACRRVLKGFSTCSPDAMKCYEPYENELPPILGIHKQGSKHPSINAHQLHLNGCRQSCGKPEILGLFGKLLSAEGLWPPPPAGHHHSTLRSATPPPTYRLAKCHSAPGPPLIPGRLEVRDRAVAGGGV